jgi:hypothetical protein
VQNDGGVVGEQQAYFELSHGAEPDFQICRMRLCLFSSFSEFSEVFKTYRE